MNIITRINNKIYRKYIKLLPTKTLISKAKKYIKKSNFMPIVIMFHKVTDVAQDPFSVSKDVMEKYILFFKKHGFKFLFEEEFLESNTYSVILSFDDGYQNNYTNVFPLLKKHNAKASINIIAKKIVDEFENDYLTVDEIKELINSGLVSVQSHSYSHKKLAECSSAELLTEIRDSKTVLEDKLGINCSVLVTPYLQNSQKVLTESKKHYKLVYSSNINNQENRYCISRIGSSDNFSEKQLARTLCVKAKKNAETIKHNAKQY